VFCGRHLLLAKLRRSDIDASAGSVEQVKRIVWQLRARWPHVRILLRADSGFAREALMAWCEENRVDYVFGLARNTRLVAMIEADLASAKAMAESTGRPARRFKDLQWSTHDRWSRRRRVVAKAEWTQGEANPRFIVTSLKRAETGARHLYADRTSAATMRANQLRLWFASMAYVLMCALRRIGLAETIFADATCGTIRLKFLKIGALIRISVRRVRIAIASACPTADAWGEAARRLANAANARAAPA
jgi:Transposase DDE domain group 1